MIDTKKFHAASHLLPDPGGEVVRQLCDEIDRLCDQLDPESIRHWDTMREHRDEALQALEQIYEAIYPFACHVEVSDAAGGLPPSDVVLAVRLLLRRHEGADAPVDFDDIVKAVQDADQLFKKEGGSRHDWVRECFIPSLREYHFAVVHMPPKPPLPSKETSP
jgi:hypothetical protein